MRNRLPCSCCLPAQRRSARLSGMTPFGFTPPVRQRAGFTYVEVLVAATIMSLVAGVSMVLTESGRRMWLVTDAKLTSLQSGQIALNRLAEDLREASQTGLNCTASQLDFNLANPIIPVSYTLDLATKTLLRTVGGTPQAVAGGILGFTPTCMPNGLVRLDITAQTQAPQSQTPQPIRSRTMQYQIVVPNP